MAKVVEGKVGNLLDCGVILHGYGLHSVTGNNSMSNTRDRENFEGLATTKGITGEMVCPADRILGNVKLRCQQGKGVTLLNSIGDNPVSRFC